MAQKAIEVILMRQLAGGLGTPVLLFDQDAHLIHYNPAAEVLLGRCFDEDGARPRQGCNPLERAAHADGTPLTQDEHPLSIALSKGRSAHGEFWLPCAQDVRRRLCATATPLETEGVRQVGAMVLLWEAERP